MRTQCRVGRRTTSNGISPRHKRLNARTFTASGGGTPPPILGDALLMETSDYLLLESGDKILLET